MRVYTPEIIRKWIREKKLPDDVSLYGTLWELHDQLLINEKLREELRMARANSIREGEAALAEVLRLDRVENNYDCEHQPEARKCPICNPGGA